MTGFKHGDLVLGVIPSYPAWPSFVINEKYVSKNVVKHKPSDNYICCISLGQPSYFFCQESELVLLTKEHCVKFLKDPKNQAQNRFLVKAFREASDNPSISDLYPEVKETEDGEASVPLFEEFQIRSKNGTDRGSRTSSRTASLTITKLNERISELEKTNRDLKSKVNTQKKSLNKGSSDKVEGLTSENYHLKSKIERLQTKLHEYKSLQKQDNHNAQYIYDLLEKIRDKDERLQRLEKLNYHLTHSLKESSKLYYNQEFSDSEVDLNFDYSDVEENEPGDDSHLDSFVDSKPVIKRRLSNSSTSSVDSKRLNGAAKTHTSSISTPLGRSPTIRSPRKSPSRKSPTIARTPEKAAPRSKSDLSGLLNAN